MDFTRLRYYEFVEKLEWDLTNSRSCEYDQYDFPNAMFVVAYIGRRCVGGARLLPTNTTINGTDGIRYTYMLNDFFNGTIPGANFKAVMSVAPPRSENVWELTRFVSTGRDVMKALLYRIDDYLLNIGATEVLTVSPIFMPRLLRSIGFETYPISDEILLDGRAYLALSSRVGRKMRRAPDEDNSPGLAKVGNHLNIW